MSYLTVEQDTLFLTANNYFFFFLNPAATQSNSVPLHGLPGYSVQQFTKVCGPEV